MKALGSRAVFAVQEAQNVLFRSKKDVKSCGKELADAIAHLEKGLTATLAKVGCPSKRQDLGQDLLLAGF